MALSGTLLTNSGPSAPVRAAHAAAFFCVGDCNLDRTVTIDEFLIGVNIALGIRSTHDCPSFDSDGNAAVTVDELVTAVRSALDGCDATPTSTPTPIDSPACHDTADCIAPSLFCLETWNLFGPG